MTDDKIIEAVARAIDHKGLKGNNMPYAYHFGPIISATLARAAIEAYKAALAEDGFVIHRFHDWVYPDPYPLCNALCPPPHCRRCGIQMGGVLDAASCVPGEAATDRKERE